MFDKYQTSVKIVVEFKLEETMARRRKRRRKIKVSVTTIIIALAIAIFGGYTQMNNQSTETTKTTTSVSKENLQKLNYDGQQVVNVNNGKPTFTKDDLSIAHGSWQTFSDLDSLNRVGTANAILGKDLMPTKERDPLYIQPTGWHNKQVNSDGNRVWLYNRSHIIGFQLTGENNNPKNLMTGTASMNAPGMEEYESRVAKYIKATNHHVRYQVEPIFRDNELLARGVHMQAQSIEDDQISFNIYIFNIQKNVTLNYNDGTSVQN